MGQMNEETIDESDYLIKRLKDFKQLSKKDDDYITKTFIDNIELQSGEKLLFY